MNSNFNAQSQAPSSGASLASVRIDGLGLDLDKPRTHCEAIDALQLRERVAQVVKQQDELSRDGYTAWLVDYEEFIERRSYMESDQFLCEVARGVAFLRRSVKQPSYGIAWSRMDAEFAARGATTATQGEVGVGALIVAAITEGYRVGRKRFSRTAWFDWSPVPDLEWCIRGGYNESVGVALFGHAANLAIAVGMEKSVFPQMKTYQ